MGLFGTSGIRDLCPQRVTLSLALRASFLHFSKSASAAVAYDSRQSGQMLKAASLSGAMQAGAHAHDLGICPTPTLSLFSKMHGCPAIMITASHNPYEYNGMKFFDGGWELTAEQEKKIELGLKTQNISEPCAWDACGEAENSFSSARDAHLRLIKNFVDFGAIKKEQPQAIVDCANMAGSTISPLALEQCGCKVERVNCSAQKPSPRALEPNKGSLAPLCEQVVRSGADFAIAHDGDADRAIVISEEGKVLGLDGQLAIVARYILQNGRGKKIVSTVESSLSLREAAEEFGAELEITPVGSMKVAAQMRRSKAIFGGEPCGEYIFADATPSPDGILAGAFFAQIFAKEGKLSSLARQIKAYPIMREKIPCENSRKMAAMEKISAQWPFSSPNTSDGLRSDEDWGWVLVRPSGTEPCIRITIEAKSKMRLEKNFAAAKDVVVRYCK
ncbi:MAG: hypothetical protein V1822_02290 [Candidatus Micrarchaeota archaeon]